PEASGLPTWNHSAGRSPSLRGSLSEHTAPCLREALGSNDQCHTCSTLRPPAPQGYGLEETAYTTLNAHHPPPSRGSELRKHTASPPSRGSWAEATTQRAQGIYTATNTFQVQALAYSRILGIRPRANGSPAGHTKWTAQHRAGITAS
ncbi:unnamed protein product, partial [Heterosigma akashiwo]